MNIPDTNVRLRRFGYNPAGRTGVQAAIYHVAQFVVLLMSLFVFLGNIVYRIIAFFTCGLLDYVMVHIQAGLTWVVSRLFAEFGPNNVPYSLINVADPVWALPRQVDEVSAMIVFARLAYEAQAQKQPILDRINVPGEPQLSFVEELGVIPGQGLARAIHVGGVRLWRFAVADTQVFLGRFGTSLVVAFRGTEPLSLTDWSTDFNLGLEATPQLGYMHRGFKEAMGMTAAQIAGGRQSLYARIVAAIDKHQRAGNGIDQTVFVTGHSLGAGLAATFSALYMRDNPQAVVRTYPFAQPRIGDVECARALEQLVAAHRNRVYRRFVNNNDIVNRVPGCLTGYRFETDGPFLANGCETYYIDKDFRISRLPRGYWSEQPPLQPLTWFYKARTRFNRDSCLRYAIRLVGIPAPYGLFVNDHFPMDYQAAIVESSDAHVQ